jgi:hypothetical protein
MGAVHAQDRGGGGNVSDEDKIARENRHDHIIARALAIIADAPADPIHATRHIAGAEMADLFAREWGDWTLARDAAAHRQAVIEVEREGE